MKYKILTIVAAAMVMVACKKESACTCTTISYVDGVYNGSETKEYLVNSESKCKEYEAATTTETTSCTYAE